MAANKDTHQQVSTWMPRELVARLDAYAKDQRWSRSTAIEALIEAGLPRAEESAKQD